ncbi:hypothetical protein N7494_013187 [Penicillium frequentans]|uniref:Uncharacterized protein n=1 Tax=Penicillium frequentans TaxID=3151616 RepID=A0AAD6G9L9_9EURO|nr:hypothetical protein N7494_013187 [Penicillium glabrum]
MKYLNKVSDRIVLASVSGSHRFARIISGTANDERTPARSDRLLVYFQPRDVHYGQVWSCMLTSSPLIWGRSFAPTH